MTQQTFKTSMDKLAKAITYGFPLVLIILLTSAILMSPDAATLPFSFFIFTLVWILPWLFSPTQYICSETQLIIKRAFKPVIIEIKDILNIRQAEKDELKSLFRLFGSGGLFGYYGKFSDSKHKNFLMYSRRRDHKVMLFTKQGLVVVSPDDPENFIQCIRKALINK